MVKTLVVARYNEDLSWLEKIPSDWKPLPVYKEIDVPNTGREASSYFWVLAEKLRPVPTDTIAFVQGDPFTHCEDFFYRLKKPVTSFTPYGHRHISCDQAGHPHHDGLPVGQYWDKWIGGPRPERYEFVAGAQFAITGTEALRYSKDWYRNMFEEANKDPAAWVLERLWGYLFG